MSILKPIQTAQAPQAIGCYSQAVQAGSWLFLSGQIGLDPVTQQLVSAECEAQLQQVFKNLEAVLTQAGANWSHVVKLNVYLTDLQHFSLVNDLMHQTFKEPYPARAAVQVAALPKGALVEVDGMAVLPAGF